MKKYFPTVVFILLMVSSGFGCAATTGNLSSVKDYSYHNHKSGSRSFYLKKSTSLVFGRSIVHENKAAKEKKHAPSYFIVGPSPDVFSKWLEMPATSFFIWRLPPGEYQILSILPESGAGMVLEPTPIQFHIPDSQKAYYLGDLVVDWDVENVKLGERITRRRCNAVNSLELKDGFEEMRNKFADNYAFPREKIEKSLMEIADPFEPEEKQLILRSSSKYKAMRTRFEVAGDRANDLAPLEMIFPFVPPVN